ncbi:methyltransferase domain-containing protein [Desulfitibacter alkalitolerans]|uniref:methyltransferase domain-containing protein n=1 Tax=Desulfitibacter alkalitolerans TaxID=264641 RepID=UPI0006844D1A|nr:methyltransferase domain-containing protein [Desulfitibacter alkalitolerans]
MKIDLGSGKRRQPGYIGIDRIDIPGVDIVADINKGIPLENDVVDYVIASHSLEHVDDLMKTMEEIYRVCKHMAIVCIVAPYFNTSLNMANPYHKQAFNEHTPRFFTSNNNYLIPKEDYKFPSSASWGLGESDNSNLKIDFRCLSIEYFYFPEYRMLSEIEKSELRRSRINVVDEIMYHLLVIKRPTSVEEIEKMKLFLKLEEPNHVTIRRYVEKYQDLMSLYEKDKTSWQNELMAVKKELTDYRLIFQEKIVKEMQHNDKETKSDLRKELRNKEEDIQKLKEELKKYKDEKEKMSIQFKHNLESLLTEKETEVSKKIQEKNEIYRQKEQLEKEYIHVQNSLSNNTKMLKKVILQKNIIIEELLHENNLLKKTKAYRLMNVLRYLIKKESRDLTQLINKDCKPLLDSSILSNTKSLNRYILGFSSPITTDEILYYNVYCERDGWNKVEVALSCINDSIQGVVLGFEVLSADGKSILRTVFLKTENIKHNNVSVINFEPIKQSNNNSFIVRFVGLKNIEKAGVSIYEWQKLNMFGVKRDVQFFGKLSYAL